MAITSSRASSLGTSRTINNDPALLVHVQSLSGWGVALPGTLGTRPNGGTTLVLPTHQDTASPHRLHPIPQTHDTIYVVYDLSSSSPRLFLLPSKDQRLGNMSGTEMVTAREA